MGAAPVVHHPFYDACGREGRAEDSVVIQFEGDFGFGRASHTHSENNELATVIAIGTAVAAKTLFFDIHSIIAPPTTP